MCVVRLHVYVYIYTATRNICSIKHRYVSCIGVFHLLVTRNNALAYLSHSFSLSLSHKKAVVSKAAIEAKAQAISEGVAPAEMPSLKDLEKARRRQRKRDNTEAFGFDCAADWLQHVQTMQARQQVLPYQFRYVSLHCKLSWLPVSMLARDQPQPAEGSTMLISDNNVELTRRMLQSGHRKSASVTMCLDATYKLSTSGGAQDRRNREQGQKKKLCIQMSKHKPNSSKDDIKVSFSKQNVHKEWFTIWDYSHSWLSYFLELVCCDAVVRLCADWGLLIAGIMMPEL